jgi:hypothetical protein
MAMTSPNDDAADLSALFAKTREEAFATEGANEVQNFTRGERVFFLFVAGTALDLAARAIGANSIHAAIESERMKGMSASQMRIRIAALERRIEILERK